MNILAQIALYTAQAACGVVMLLTVHAMAVSAGKPPCADISSAAALNACYAE